MLRSLLSSLSALVSLSVQELYERLVEAERQRAEAEKARGDDLREIAMALASGKKGELSKHALHVLLRTFESTWFAALTGTRWRSLRSLCRRGPGDPLFPS